MRKSSSRGRVVLAMISLVDSLRFLLLFVLILLVDSLRFLHSLVPFLQGLILLVDS